MLHFATVAKTKHLKRKYGEFTLYESVVSLIR